MKTRSLRFRYAMDCTPGDGESPVPRETRHLVLEIDRQLLFEHEEHLALSEVAVPVKLAPEDAATSEASVGPTKDLVEPSIGALRDSPVDIDGLKDAVGVAEMDGMLRRPAVGCRPSHLSGCHHRPAAAGTVERPTSRIAFLEQTERQMPQPKHRNGSMVAFRSAGLKVMASNWQTF